VNKGGIGVGSASVVLVFAVLCLTVFSLISFVVAENDKALVDAGQQLMTGYYKADSQAEQILAQLLESDATPSNVLGVDITTGTDDATGVEYISYGCPISDDKVLDVKVTISGNSYEILNWRMLDTGDWVTDDKLNVWLGPDDGSIDLGDQMGLPSVPAN